MKKYQVFEMPLKDERFPNETEEQGRERILRDRESPRLVVLRGGLGEADPQQFMDDVVSDYVQHYGHNQFIEHFLDNPWVRVLIFGINELPYDERDFEE